MPLAALVMATVPDWLASRKAVSGYKIMRGITGYRQYLVGNRQGALGRSWWRVLPLIYRQDETWAQEYY